MRVLTFEIDLAEKLAHFYNNDVECAAKYITAKNIEDMCNQFNSTRPHSTFMKDEFGEILCILTHIKPSKKNTHSCVIIGEMMRLNHRNDAGVDYTEYDDNLNVTLTPYFSVTFIDSPDEGLTRIYKIELFMHADIEDKD